MCAPANNNEELEDELSSLEEQPQATLRPELSAEASNARSTLQHLEQPIIYCAGLQVNRAQLRPGENQSGSRVVLDNDDSIKAGARFEAEGTFGGVNARHIERDTSLQRTFRTSELALAPIKSIDTSGLRNDAGEPALGLGSHEQHDVPSSAQAQPQTLSPTFQATKRSGLSARFGDDVTQSTSLELAFHFSLGFLMAAMMNGLRRTWLNERKELGLGLEKQQVKSSSTGAPTSQSPRLVDAPHDETQSRKSAETTCSIAQGLEEWEQQGTEMVESGGVAMQEHEQEELSAQKK